MFFQCNIKTDMSTLETWGSAMMDLRNRLVDFQTQTDKIVDFLSLRNTVANQSSLIGSVDHAFIGGPSNSVSPSPTSGKTAPSLRIESDVAKKEDEDIISAEIPFLSEAELQRCPTLTIPKLDQIPTILLAPESSGVEY